MKISVDMKMAYDQLNPVLGLQNKICICRRCALKVPLATSLGTRTLLEKFLQQEQHNKIYVATATTKTNQLHIFNY